jgi:hypothetical protein
MKKFLAILLVSLLFAAPTFGMSKKSLEKLKDKEHQSLHELIMVDRDSNGKIVGGGLCTAYATGPHTLVTAAHCNDPYTNDVYIDAGEQSVHDNTAPSYKVSRQFDHEDHMLLNIESVNFVDFKEYVPLAANLPLPVQGDHFYFWGNMQGIVNQYREGVVMGSMPFDAKTDDPEIDVDGNRLYMLTGPALPGDSGSSVFNSKGERIAILTYGIDDGAIIGVFPIQFTQDQIDTSLSTVAPDSFKSRPPNVGGDEARFPFILFSRSQHGSSHTPSGHAAPPRSEPHHSGPRGGYHGSPKARPHWHDGHFDHDYYVAHFGVWHPFFVYDLFWYGDPYFSQSVFVFDDCGFVVLSDVPVYMRGVSVYVVEIDGAYYLTSAAYPSTFVGLEVVL